MPCINKLYLYICMYIRQVTQLGDMPVVAAVERPQIRPKYPGLDLLENVNDSGVRKLAINSNSMSSEGKRPGRLCQTPGPCRASGSHFREFSKCPQDIISRLSFVSVYNSWGTCRMGSRARCMLVIQILVTVIALCVFESVRPHSGADSIDASFIHHRHN